MVVRKGGSILRLKFFDAIRLENVSCNVYFSDVDIPPRYLIKNKTVWKIVVPDEYKIKKLRILVNTQDEIVKVRVDSPHPNASLFDGDFCLPQNLYGVKLNDNSYNYLLTMIERWNVDSCYFIPGDFKYRKQVGNIFKKLYRRNR